MYEQQLAISRQAFAEATFELAYHTLAPAMGRARDLDDLPLLKALLQEVERQKKQIDRAYPTHRFTMDPRRWTGKGSGIR